MDDKMITRIEELGIVPVVKLSRADDAVPLAKALIAGGLSYRGRGYVSVPPLQKNPYAAWQMHFPKCW